MPHVTRPCLLVIACLTGGCIHSYQSNVTPMLVAQTRVFGTPVQTSVSSLGWFFLSPPRMLELNVQDALADKCRSRLVSGVQTIHYVRNFLGIAQQYVVKGTGFCVFRDEVGSARKVAQRDIPARAPRSAPAPTVQASTPASNVLSAGCDLDTDCPNGMLCLGVGSAKKCVAPATPNSAESAGER